LSTTSAFVANCTVTAYNQTSGLVTFSATPTVQGMNTLYVRITAPASSYIKTTLSYAGTGQGYFVDNALIGITSSAGALATRSFNGASYTCVRASGTLTIPATINNAEILMIAGGGGGAFLAGGGGGAGGLAHITGATIPQGSYAVTVGAGGAGSLGNGSDGTAGGNSVAFGMTVYGGGGGSHTGPNVKTLGNSGGCGGGSGYRFGGGGAVTTGADTATPVQALRPELFSASTKDDGLTALMLDARPLAAEGDAAVTLKATATLAAVRRRRPRTSATPVTAMASLSTDSTNAMAAKKLRCALASKVALV
jgi:hypothetical protein